MTFRLAIARLGCALNTLEAHCKHWIANRTLTFRFADLKQSSLGASYPVDALNIERLNVIVVIALHLCLHGRVIVFARTTTTLSDRVCACLVQVTAGECDCSPES